jgi:DNA-binding NtrC family response regulator
LLVDAEAASRRLFERYLTAEGFDIRGAGTREEALDLIESGWAEVVLVEQILPDGSAEEVVEATRRYDERIPVLLLSSFAGLEKTLNAQRMGAFDFILKPVVHLELVAEKLRRALYHRKLEAEQLQVTRQVTAMVRSVSQFLDGARQAVEDGEEAVALEQLDRAQARLDRGW